MSVLGRLPKRMCGRLGPTRTPTLKRGGSRPPRVQLRKFPREMLTHPCRPWAVRRGGGHAHVCAETHTEPQKHPKTPTRGPKILPRVGNEREAKEGDPDAQKTQQKTLRPSNGGAKP